MSQTVRQQDQATQDPWGAIPVFVSFASPNTSLGKLDLLTIVDKNNPLPVAIRSESGGSKIGNVTITDGRIQQIDVVHQITSPVRVDLMTDPSGRLLVAAAERSRKGNQQTTITASTSETTIITADSEFYTDLYAIILTNTSATITTVTIKDRTTGTNRIVFSVPANDTRGFVLPVADAHKQQSKNQNWTATCGTSVTSIEITALFVRN